MKKLMGFKKSEKGFTLIEIIVVLVVLALLAAIAIPTLIGYVNDAKKKQILTEARAVLVSVQAQAVYEYAADGDVLAADITPAEVNALLGEDYIVADTEAGDDGYLSITVSAAGKVTGIVYSNNGYTATYASGAWSTAKV